MKLKFEIEMGCRIQAESYANEVYDIVTHILKFYDKHNLNFYTVDSCIVRGTGRNVYGLEKIRKI